MPVSNTGTGGEASAAATTVAAAVTALPPEFANLANAGAVHTHTAAGTAETKVVVNDAYYRVLGVDTYVKVGNSKANAEAGGIRFLAGVIGQVQADGTAMWIDAATGGTVCWWPSA